MSAEAPTNSIPYESIEFLADWAWPDASSEAQINWFRKTNQHVPLPQKHGAGENQPPPRIIIKTNWFG